MFCPTVRTFFLSFLLLLALALVGCGGGGGGDSSAPAGGSSNDGNRNEQGGDQGNGQGDDGEDEGNGDEENGDGEEENGNAAGSVLQFRQSGSWLEVEVDNSGEVSLNLSLEAPGGTTRSRAPAGVRTTLFLDVPAGDDPLQDVAADLLLKAPDGGVLDRRSLTVLEPVALGSAPLLALSPTARDDLIQRYQNDNRTAYALGQQVLLPADNYLAQPTAVPERGGAWAGSGDADGLLITRTHKELAEVCFKLGIAYVLKQDVAYAEGVRDMLLEYARLYPTYKLHDRSGAEEGQRLLPDAARMMAQTLDEARCLMEFARALDLIRGSGVVDAAQQEAIANDFLRPSAQLLRGHEKGIHNIQCWLNLAAFLAFLQADDLAAARACVSGKNGLEQILAEGVASDGTWVEGSFMYHYFAGEALVPLVRALQACAVPCDTSALEKMLEAPFALAAHDGTLPMVNDGVQIGLGQSAISQAKLYEQGVRIYSGDRLAWPLRRWTRGQDYLSLIYGGAVLPPDPPADPPPSIVLPDLGMAMVRTGPAAFESTLAIDYGPHGGDHGHPDKLSLHAWLGGRPAFGEASTNLYGERLYQDYFKRSLAHSTVLLNGQDQRPARGTLLRFDSTDQIIEVRSDQAYLGATLTRLSHLTPDGHLIDLFLVEGAGSASVDYVLHGYGQQISTSAPFLDAADAGYQANPAYRALRKVKVLDTADDVDIRFSDAFGSHTVRIAGLPGTHLILAEGPWFQVGTYAPMLIVRRSGARALIGVAAVDGPSFPSDFLLQWDLAKAAVQYQSAGRLEGLELEISP